MNSILKQTQEKLNNKNSYITEADDVFYLTRFKSSALSVMLLNDQWYAITDQRYFENATKQITHMTVVDNGNKESMEKMLEGVTEINLDSSNTTVARYEMLKKAWGEKGIEVNAIDFPLIRFGYSGDDITKLEKSSKLVDEIFTTIKSKIRVGMTEKDVEAIILKEVIDSEASGVSFDPIVATGPSGSSPHWSPTNRVIESNQMMTIDMGVFLDGFASDMTRTFVVDGKVSEEEELIWNTVKKSMEETILLIRPGITGKELDEHSRKIIEEAGYGEYFTHGLGHAVGINVHESPRVNKFGIDELKPGMVITIEPGIYIPGKYGVRLEHSVLVTETGYKVLNNTPVELY